MLALIIPRRFSLPLAFCSGFSEFTHPDDHLMLALMNELADYEKAKYNRFDFASDVCVLRCVLS